MVEWKGDHVREVNGGGVVDGLVEEVLGKGEDFAHGNVFLFEGDFVVFDDATPV